MDVDALIFSGHKTYAPGSPGVVIARKDLIGKIEPEEVGGGMVDRVFPERYYVKDEFPDREAWLEALGTTIAGGLSVLHGLEAWSERDSELEAAQRVTLDEQMPVFGASGGDMDFVRRARLESRSAVETLLASGSLP